MIMTDGDILLLQTDIISITNLIISLVSQISCIYKHNKNLFVSINKME